jgi:hypothetical protein
MNPHSELFWSVTGALTCNEKFWCRREDSLKRTRALDRAAACSQE